MDTAHHLREGFVGDVASEQISTTPFQQPRDILDVGTSEVVQTAFEHVQNQMGRHDPGLREVR